MAEEKYYIITTTEDGEVYLEEMVREELLKEMEERVEETTDKGKEYADSIQTKIPVDHAGHKFIDLQEEGRVFIIKGKLVSLKPVKYVVEYEIYE